jgi:Putative peptidoglycan binding domain
MLGDGAISSTIASWWGKVRPQGARRERAPANDSMFIDVVADFSRKLGERVARQTAGGLAAAQQERREALRAYDHARRRQQMLTAGVAVGALIALGIASLAPPIAPPVSAPPAVAAAPAAPPPPVMVAAAQPTVVPDTVQPAPAPTSTPAPVPPPATAMASPAPEPLRVDEVREVQKRLHGFGFSPGPADGVAGRLTANAVMSYQQNRGQPQTGDIDRDLLLQLREDPAPQVAPPPQRTAQRAARRSSNPFDQFSRWLDSVMR